MPLAVFSGFCVQDKGRGLCRRWGELCYTGACARTRVCVGVCVCVCVCESVCVSPECGAVTLASFFAKWWLVLLLYEIRVSQTGCLLGHCVFFVFVFVLKMTVVTRNPPHPVPSACLFDILFALSLSLYLCHWNPCVRACLRACVPACDLCAGCLSDGWSFFWTFRAVLHEIALRYCIRFPSSRVHS